MKKKKFKIDNNSYFLLLMSGFFVFIFILLFAVSDTGKVTYSADTSSCNGTQVGTKCCTGSAITSFTSSGTYTTEDLADKACNSYVNLLIYDTKPTCSTTQVGSSYTYGGNTYETELEAQVACETALNKECVKGNDYSENDSWKYTVTGTWYASADCKANDPSLSTSTLTFFTGIGENSRTLEATGGAGGYKFAAEGTCAGFAISESGTITANADATDFAAGCYITVTDNKGASSRGYVRFTVVPDKCVKQSDGSYKICNGNVCRGNSIPDEGSCKYAIRSGFAASCNTFKPSNGGEYYYKGVVKYENTDIESGYCYGNGSHCDVKPAEYKCPNNLPFLGWVADTKDCGDASKVFDLTEMIPVFLSGDGIGLQCGDTNTRKVYACCGDKASSSSLAPKTSAPSTNKPSSNPKPSNPSEIYVNPPTGGGGLMILLWMMTLFMIGFSVIYFKDPKKDKE